MSMTQQEPRDAVQNTADNTDRKTAGLKPPWKPGQSGNPRGRPPKEKSLTSLLREELEQREPKTGETYERLLARAIVRGGAAAALKGHDALAKLIFERVEGKVPDIVDLRSLSILVNKPIEQMSLEELDAYDRELQSMIDKYAPVGLPQLLKEADDPSSAGSPGGT